MVNAKLHLYKNNAVSKTYIFEGFLNKAERKTQTSIDLPFPLRDDSSAIINSIFGQKRIFNCTFIIMDRTDDYTDGTGSPVTKTAEEQRKFIMNDIFVATGFHVFRDTSGNLYSGRVEDIQIVNAGDDPLKLDAIFTFKRGIVPTAGNFISI